MTALVATLRTAAATLMLLASTQEASSQRTVVVADADTGLPVAHASLWTKSSRQFHSATTDDQGRATIGFAFDRLTVTHLNYHRRTLSALTDTIRLKPRYSSVPEVTVTNKEPAWIRPTLKRIVKRKEALEQQITATPTRAYHYDTQSIGGRTFYNFKSDGLLRLKGSDQKLHLFRQDDATITSADSTRLTDFATLRRMLYEDFYDNFSNGFISDHRFRETDRNTGDKNVVELYFRSKRRNDDRGRMVIDTARCLILSVQRTVGTESNRHRLASPMLLAFARMLTGYRILKWDIDYAAEYDGMAPTKVRYKLFMKTKETAADKEQQQFEDSIGGGFANMEGTLTLEQPTNAKPDSLWRQLPRSWYIAEHTDAERQQELELSRMPATFIMLSDDDQRADDAERK